MSLETTDTGNPVGSTVADTSSKGAAPDMDATLRSAYREAMARETDGSDSIGQEEASSEGRNRGPDGKFLPKTKTNGVAAPTEAAANETVAQPTEVEPAATALQPKPYDAAPNTWKKELGAEFGKLPENVRQEIHRREEDFHKGIGQYKEAAGFGTQLAKELLPYQQTMLKHNIHPAEVVKQATQVWNTLVTGTPQEKANLWLQIAKDHAINLSSLGADPQQGTTELQVDPNVEALKRELSEIKGHLTAQERQRAEAEYSDHVKKVQAFGSDPKHEHYQAVKEDMAKLIESGLASDLDDAYEQAIWRNLDVRKSLLAKQDQERANKAAQEAAAARKAAGANVTRRGTPPATPKAGSIEDTLKSRYRELTGA